MDKYLVLFPTILIVGCAATPELYSNSRLPAAGSPEAVSKILGPPAKETKGGPQGPITSNFTMWTYYFEKNDGSEVFPITYYFCERPEQNSHTVFGMKDRAEYRLMAPHSESDERRISPFSRKFE